MTTPPGPTPALDRLRADEQAQVLHELLRAHPDLRPQAEQTAARLVRHVSAEDVAERVVSALDDLALDQLAARAGRVPGGYVEPADAACELVLEGLAPIEADLRRCIELGFLSAARQTLLGLLAGLYRRRSPRDGTVLSHAGEDVPLEHAGWLVDEAARAGLELSGADLEALCPDWQLTIPVDSGHEGQ